MKLNPLSSPSVATRCVQKREARSVGVVPGGRTSDDAVNWFCHVRLRTLIAAGAKQKDIASRASLPEAAVSYAARSAKGIGPTTAAKLAPILGFRTRGELVDAADVWWLAEGKDYALTHQANELSSMKARLASGGVESTPIRDLPAARASHKSKAKKLLKRPDRSRQRGARE